MNGNGPISNGDCPVDAIMAVTSQNHVCVRTVKIGKYLVFLRKVKSANLITSHTSVHKKWTGTINFKLASFRQPKRQLSHGWY